MVEHDTSVPGDALRFGDKLRSGPQHQRRSLDFSGLLTLSPFFNRPSAGSNYSLDSSSAEMGIQAGVSGDVPTGQYSAFRLLSDRELSQLAALRQTEALRKFRRVCT